jgi:hypothetical protein
MHICHTYIYEYMAFILRILVILFSFYTRTGFESLLGFANGYSLVYSTLGLLDNKGKKVKFSLCLTN